MIRKAVFIGLIAALVVFGASLSFANQIDGMVSGAPGTTALPTGLITSVNPGGLGDSLIYGYYNVRGNLNIFNVVNTSTVDGAKVRVVFRNGKNSKEVLDFNVCLSRGDTWTGYLLDDGTEARIFDDGAFTSLTGINADTITAPTIPTSGQAFKQTDSTVTADDTKEGYFEIVGMSTIPNYDKNSSSTHACDGSYSDAGYNCIRTATACNDWSESTPPYDVKNVLMGNNDLVDVKNVVSHAYNATAFADSSNTAFDIVTGSEASVQYAMSNIIGNTYADACHQLDYLLTKNNVMSTFDLISALGGETEFTFTFPTRLLCHGTTTYEETNLFDGKIDPDAPNYVDQYTYTSYCTRINPSITNYDEVTPTSPLQFSPAQGTTFCLPYEVDVVKLGGSDIWDSSLATSLDNAGFSLGWINFDLRATTQSLDNHFTDLGANTTWGLPALTYTTQNLVGGMSGYMNPTAYKTNIVVTPF